VTSQNPQIWRVQWKVRRGVRGRTVGFPESQRDLTQLQSFKTNCRIAIDTSALERLLKGEEIVKVLQTIKEKYVIHH